MPGPNTLRVSQMNVVELVNKLDYATIIIADHGNADFAVNEDKSPNTAHSTNPVPSVLVNVGKNIGQNIAGCSLMWLIPLRSLSNCDYEL